MTFLPNAFVSICHDYRLYIMDCIIMEQIYFISQQKQISLMRKHLQVVNCQNYIISFLDTSISPQNSQLS